MPRFEKVIKRLLWTPGYAQGAVTNGTVSSLGEDILQYYNLDVGRELGAGYTLMRIRGTLQIQCSYAAGADRVGKRWAAALMVTPEGGFTSQPGLDSEIYDAIWRFTSFGESWFLEEAAGNFVKVPQLVQVDTRAKRVLRGAGDELHMVIQNESGVSLTAEFRGFVLLGVK